MNEDSTPTYQRITAYLSGLLPKLHEGDELPTIAELCEQFGVSGVQTVRNGVQPLVDAGYVETRLRPRRRWVVRRVPATPPTLPARAPLDELREALANAKRELDRAGAAMARL
jgi:DNA-binding GntR family transcriptional regulator